jgi:hypothetical protein
VAKHIIAGFEASWNGNLPSVASLDHVIICKFGRGLDKTKSARVSLGISRLDLDLEGYGYEWESITYPGCVGHSNGVDFEELELSFINSGAVTVAIGQVVHHRTFVRVGPLRPTEFDFGTSSYLRGRLGWSSIFVTDDIWVINCTAHNRTCVLRHRRRPTNHCRNFLPVLELWFITFKVFAIGVDLSNKTMGKSLNAEERNDWYNLIKHFKGKKKGLDKEMWVFKERQEVKQRECVFVKEEYVRLQDKRE